MKIRTLHVEMKSFRENENFSRENEEFFAKMRTCLQNVNLSVKQALKYMTLHMNFMFENVYAVVPFSLTAGQSLTHAYN